MNEDTRTIALLETPEVRVAPGASVRVEVPAKGATGHVWTVDADPSEVRILDHTREPSRESFGGGGVEVFTVQPLREGRATVRFRLGAPWRKEAAETHDLSIEVSKRPAQK